MLIPWLDGPLPFLKVPITWMIIAICCAMYGLNQPHTDQADRELQAHFEDAYFLESQAYLYGQFIEQHPQRYPQLLQLKAAQILSGAEDEKEMLATLALRDQHFLSHVDLLDVLDPIAHATFQHHTRSIARIQADDPTYDLGLYFGHSDPPKWVTYIFSHSGFLHLIGNLFFLLLFGGYIERRYGGLFTLILFLGTGVIGALTFLCLTGPTLAPLVGASGAISGLMGFLAVMEARKPVAFFYWLFLPGKRYSGLMMLPGAVLLGLWLMADLAGYLAGVSELGGIAYTAHLGGEGGGALIALGLLAVRWVRADDLSSSATFSSGLA